jgi:DNA-binding IclR family transcriptional regulator
MTTPSGTETAGRVIDVLLLFTDGPAELGVSQIARELDLSKAVVHRILQTLTARGMLTLDPQTRRYRLGATTAALGARALRNLDLRTASADVLRHLRLQTGETVTLSAVVPGGRVYIDQVVSAHEVKMTVELGRRFPLYAGSSGKCMLAFLPRAERERVLTAQLSALTDRTLTDPADLRADLERIRERGYAVSTGERQADAGSIAAPVFGLDGDVRGAVSVCGPRSRITPDFVDGCASGVLRAAAGISAALGWGGPASGEPTDTLATTQGRT